MPVYALQGSMENRSDHNGPQGSGVALEVMFTLNTTDKHSVVITASDSLRNTDAEQTSESGSVTAPSARAHAPVKMEQAKMDGVNNAAEQLSIFSLEEPLASRSASPASEKAWLIRVATSPLRILPLLTSIGPSGWSGRTSPACCRLTEEKRLEPSSEGWGNSGMGGPTESWTLSISDWPNDASVCSLSQVLEAGNVPRRFYLTPRACAGILRRAEKRGKALPVSLLQALLIVATQAASSQPSQPSQPISSLKLSAP